MEKHFRGTLSKEERTSEARHSGGLPTEIGPVDDRFCRKKIGHSTLYPTDQNPDELTIAAYPLAKLWSEVMEQGLDHDPKALVPIAKSAGYNPKSPSSPG